MVANYSTMCAQLNSPSPTLADADVERDGGDGEAQPKRCCQWLSGHTVDEAGSSRWASPKLLLLTRLLSAGYLVGYTITILVLSPKDFNFYMNVVYYIMYAASLVLLVICTSTRSTKLANVAIAIYHFCVTVTLLAIPGIIWLATQGQAPWSDVVLVVMPFLLFIIDSLVLQARVRFNSKHVFLTVILITIIVLIFNVYWSFAGLPTIYWASLPVTVFLATFTGALVCAISRIDLTTCCG